MLRSRCEPHSSAASGRGCEVWGQSSESEKQPRGVQPSEGEAFTKGVFNKAKRACREFLKSQPQKPNPRLKVPRVGMFEKAVKVFSAFAACVSPVVPR